MVSHTTTGEWQSFEVRMRRRRAERLALRAEAAIDAGCLDDAQACLAEARALAPDLPALDAVDRRLSPAPALDEPVPTRSRTATAAAAVLALASIAVLATVAWPIARTPDVQRGAVIVSAPATVPAPSAQPRDPVPQPPLAATAPPDLPPAPAPAAAPETKLPAPEPVRQEPVRQEAAASVPVTEEPRPRAPLVDPLPSAEGTSGRVTVPSPPALVSTVPTSAGVTALPSASIPAPAAPPAAPPAPEPSQEPAVRSVLERYASAYSSLDVEATQRVWPGVNRGALSRAFDGLESQHVSLGDCRIDVTGASATARCAGTASWTPRIGDGGRHSEAREWTFELARRSTGWEIVNARVQNR